MATKKPAARADQPRASKTVRSLRNALGFDEADWRSYLWHARMGFADFEQAQCMDEESPLCLSEVPDSWFETPEALGFVALRVLTKGKATLATPVARHLLQCCLPEPGSLFCPPGIGLAWLHLTRLGLDPPVSPTQLAQLTLRNPSAVFFGVKEEDLSFFGRMILEGQGAIEAWDLHELIATVESAQISVHAPYRLFNELMAEDWIERAVKREFCRGVLGCSPEDDRLRARSDALMARIRADSDDMLRFPSASLSHYGGNVRVMLPAMQRHAVRALSENVGEPLREIIAEFFLRRGDSYSIEPVTQGVLDLVKIHAEELGDDDVRSLLSKAINDGSAIVRQAAYRVGAEQFGPDFARPALKDKARMVSVWASKLLAQVAGKPGRKANPKRRPAPSGE